ncbi:transposase-like protein [Streptomyces turgidiscabies]|uniref:Transposase-like protein n=1 Tax=Streptomyces turgidiscabies TaxID=85558 RepID=A0ABU0RUS2_9ACTN|nr:transposase-like protein [Streptomyces turgidiscabies]
METGAVVSYRGFRFSAEIISHAVWLYQRFPLSFRITMVLVTDKLRSYDVAHRKLMPSVEHHSHKGLNNRAELPRRTCRFTLEMSVSANLRWGNRQRSCPAATVRCGRVRTSRSRRETNRPPMATPSCSGRALGEASA